MSRSVSRAPVSAPLALVSLSALLLLSAPMLGAAPPPLSAEPSANTASVARPVPLDSESARPLSPVPWPIAENTWRTDEAWYDGRAEVAVYRSVEFAEGQKRDTTTTFFTNHQHMDPATRTKVSVPDEQSVAVFKQHRSERIPAGAFELDLATVSFSNAATLDPFLVTFATQDSCGASFKQIGFDTSGLAWNESVYFPGGGRRDGRLGRTSALVEDQLPLVLRDFPFADAEPGKTEFRFDCVPSQRSPQRVPWTVEGRIVRYAGSEVLGLTAGEREAHQLQLLEESTGELLGSYWFAAEGEAPWLHALLRYEGADGRRLELLTLTRDAYWEQN